jgi:branched-chain amino acid transport system permease protein
MRFSTYLPYYYLLLVILVGVLFLVNRIRNSKLGFSLLALGEDEDAAEVLGVDVRASKLKALMLYAFIAGMLGGIYCCIYGYIHPSFFSTDMSMEIAILGIVGGLGITWGPATAALVLVSVREFLRARLGGELAGLYLVVYATVLIMVALFQPRGLAPLATRGVERLRSIIVGARQRGIAIAQGK